MPDWIAKPWQVSVQINPTIFEHLAKFEHLEAARRAMSAHLTATIAEGARCQSLPLGGGGRREDYDPS
jgi:hypothetical protein